MRLLHPTVELDMKREYFCVVCEIRHDGKKCSQCSRMSETLAADMRVEDVVIPVIHRLYYRTGSRQHVLAMVKPGQHLYGRSEEFGDYRLQAIGVKNAPEKV